MRLGIEPKRLVRCAPISVRFITPLGFSAVTHHDGPTVVRYGVNLTRKTLYLVLSGMVSEESDTPRDQGHHPPV
jgi:hypothetical protein